MAGRFKLRTALRRGAVPVLCLALGACAANGGDSRVRQAPAPGSTVAPTVAPTVTPGAPQPREQTKQAAYTPAGAGRPQIVQARQRLQCVPYARQLSNVQLRGDAWTWWGQAQGRYPRGQRPAVGSVLVLKRKGASRGHLAVVTQIVSDREIIASHANWLNKGRVHLNTPIRDVSPSNDWSAVKVWYTPGRVMGRSTYPAYGFVYPGTATASR
jgi:surface antigen